MYIRRGRIYTYTTKIEQPRILMFPQFKYKHVDPKHNLKKFDKFHHHKHNLKLKPCFLYVTRACPMYGLQLVNFSPLKQINNQ